jgi:hypothetical protein
MSNIKTYKIQQGDCLSLIAKRFNININTLKELNSDQIKNIDLIYADDTLRLEGNEGSPIEVDTGKRIPLPSLPKKPACGSDLCSSNIPNYVDILYVPAHPKTGNQTWYALTEEAKKAVVSEQKLFKDAVVPNRQKTFDNLNALGILSKFESKPHENFLDEKDVERLRTVMWMLTTIRSGAAKEFEQGGENGFLIFIAENEDGINYHEWLNDSLKWKQVKQFAFDAWSYVSPVTYDLGNALGFIEQIEEEDREYRLREKALRATKDKVVTFLEDEISSLEKKAMDAAGDIKSDDGTSFVYDKKRKYYTSEKQQDVAKCLEKLISLKPWSDSKLASYSHEKAKDKIEQFWGKDVSASAEYIKNLSTFKRGHSVPIKAMEAYSFTYHLLRLNEFGYVTKEQCLTKDQLFGTKPEHLGPKSLSEHKKYKKWREDDSLKIAHEDYRDVVTRLLGELLTSPDQVRDQKFIQQVLESKASSISQWAYYPTHAFISFIDRTLSYWLSSVKSIVGQPIPNMFSDLIWVKKLAQERLEQLKRNAKRAANRREFNYFHLDSESLANQTLVWEELKFIPNEKKLGVFSNKAKDADLQAVECTLLSTGGELGWVRGPVWFLPTGKENKSKGHSKDITEKVAFVDPLVNGEKAGKNFQETLTDLNKQFKESVTKRNFVASPLNLNETISKFDSSAFWQADYHWQGGRAQGGGSAYVANAQAQFLRLSSSASGTLNMPLSELDTLSPNLDLTAGASIQSKFTLLSGQVAFTSWFPVNKEVPDQRPISGFGLDIPYVARNNANENERRTYSAGECFVKLSAKVYGVAAASCQLSGNLSFGLSETDGGIGVKGKSIKVFDPNRSEDTSVRARVVSESEMGYPNAAVQSGAKVDVFAGVEAGGTIDAEVHWKPPVVSINGRPVEQAAGKLGSIGAQLAANYGIGYSGELRFAFQNGQVILITSARAVCGPGFSGKFSVTLSPVLLDRFLDSLLRVLKESGFRYVEVFGELDENGKNRDFELLNERLTTAMALGIGFADVMLLPTVAYDSYKKDVLRDDFGPLIASHIVGRDNPSLDNAESRMKWVRNLPPETLANLLSSLSSIEEAPWIYESSDDADRRKLDETTKVKAIATVLSWISPKALSERNARCRQFEETLIRMGGDLEEVSQPGAQWQRFAESWKNIEGFIQSAQPDQITMGIINNSLRQLAANMAGYRYLAGSGEVYYRAYRLTSEDDSELIKNERERIVAVYDSDLRWKKFKEWTIQL